MTDVLVRRDRATIKLAISKAEIDALASGGLMELKHDLSKEEVDTVKHHAVKDISVNVIVAETLNDE